MTEEKCGWGRGDDVDVYFTDLLAQHLGLDYHPLAVRSLPESAGERVCTPLLETQTDT